MTDVSGGENGTPKEDHPLNERANLLRGIRDRHEEIKKDHWLDLSIPGYEDMLWARFKPFPVSKTESKIEQLSKARDSGRPIMLNAACDNIADACEEVMLLPARFDGDIGEEGANLISIDEDEMIPIKFDERLLKALDLDIGDQVKTTRGVIMALFPSEQAIVAMSAEITKWMQTIGKKANEALVGE